MHNVRITDIILIKGSYQALSSRKSIGIETEQLECNNICQEALKN